MERRQDNAKLPVNGNQLARWIIKKAAESEAYRAGMLTGMKHPKPDREMIKASGGLPELIRQADELEQNGYIQTEKSNLGADMKKIRYSLDIVPKLCEEEGIEDPRKQQLRYIEQMKRLRVDVKDSFLEEYYDEIIKRLEKGKVVKSPDLEDLDFFRCLNAIVNLKEPLWMRVFSAVVLNDSKRFKKDYEKKVTGVLTRSPLYEEGMSDDEILSIHGILSYTQVMEWKGPLLYKLQLKSKQEHSENQERKKEVENQERSETAPEVKEGEMAAQETKVQRMSEAEKSSERQRLQETDQKAEAECAPERDLVIDTAQNQYGTVINSQTLERALPILMNGVRQIITIENKANYEEMKYRDDTLYLFCHGFYSPKERVFLKRLTEVAEEGIQYFHWGDMDLGGIRIFQFNKKNIFPKLQPYKMDRKTFLEAVEKGAGIPLEEKKREKLEKLDAGELEDLKDCILEKGMEIEQEILLAGNFIDEI